MVRIGGQVTFDWTGFENVEQVSDFDSYTPISDGIRSGDPTTAGSFTHTFDTAGEYYFASPVYDTLRAKVTVMDCITCEVVAGYHGAEGVQVAVGGAHGCCQHGNHDNRHDDCPKGDTQHLRDCLLDHYNDDLVYFTRFRADFGMGHDAVCRYFWWEQDLPTHSYEHDAKQKADR